MKKTLLALLILTVTQLQSQVWFNKAFHEVNERPGGFLVSIHNELYFTTFEYAKPGYGGTNVYKYDKNGNQQFRLPAPGGNALRGFRSLDNKLILVGNEPVCDVIDAPYKFIAKLDTNGLAVFTSTFAAPAWDDPRECLQLSDSTFMTFTDSLVFTHSKTGQLISKTNLKDQMSITSITAAMQMQNGTLLISAKAGGVSSLITFSSNPTGGTPFATPVLMTKLLHYGGQKILARGADGLFYKLSPGLNTIGTSNLPNGLLATDFTCKNDSIYTLMTSPSAWSNYAVLDTSFTTLHMSTTTTHSLAQYAICLNGPGVAILGSSWYTSTSIMARSHYFASLSGLDKFGSNNFTDDVALTRLVLDSAYTASNYGYLRAKATIKNNGNRMLSSFKLNCYELPAIDCGGYYYQELFSGLNLMPGDTIQVTTKTFVRKPYASPSSKDYCFYATVPNGTTDKVYADNYLCRNIDLLSSIDEYSGLVSLIVFPNPFGDQLSISSDRTIKTLSITNALGMLVDQKEVNNATFTYDGSHLSQGIYFLRIQTERGTAVQKIVRQ